MQVNITLQNNTATSDPTTLHTSTSDYAEFHSNDANYRITFPNDTPFSVSTFTCAPGSDVRQNVRPGAAQKEYKYNLKNLNTGVEVDPKVIIQP
jgi:hypothetical protein